MNGSVLAGLLLRQKSFEYTSFLSWSTVIKLNIPGNVPKSKTNKRHYDSFLK
jgi:hypothetical protein